MADNQNVIVTKAGIEALINAEKTGTEKLTLDSVKLTSAPFDATYNTESISDDAVCATLTAVGGEQTGDQTISVTATDNSDAAYSAYGFGIYAGDVLFAVYSASSPIINKVAGSAAMLAADIFVSNGSVASIAFGDVSFRMPAATNTKEGAIRIATDTEALAKTDSTIALCPANLKTLNFAVATDVSDTYATKSSIVDDWYAHLPINTAATHNCFYRGKDLTAAFDSGEFSEHVADGSFTDIFPGDFIKKAITVSGTAYTVKWIIMELDYWLNTLGSTPVTAHHAVILPETPPFNAYMNSTNTTSGGYTQCAMYKNTIPAFAAGLTAAFGAGHILTFQEWFSTHTNDTVQSTAYGGWQGASTGWDGTEKALSFTCNLMNSMMAFGAPIWSSSGFDSFSAVHQFAAFRMNPSLIYANRSWYWLRDVASSSAFAVVGGGGGARAGGASDVGGVRPFALLA